jgi:hypothetical protein
VWPLVDVLAQVLGDPFAHQRLQRLEVRAR